MSLDTNLREFAKSLAPTDGQCRAFNKVIKDLTQILNHDFSTTKFSIDRLVVAGSYEKATGIKFNMDLDVVVFFNEEEPPFKDLPSTVGEAIKTSPFSKPYLRLINYEPRECTVNFVVRLDVYEIKIDVVLATNKVFGGHREKIGKSQWSNTIQEMKTLEENDRKLRQYALTEASIAFIKKQSSEIHELIRLAKCWSFANFDKIAGSSSLVETIAVHAGQKVWPNASQAETRGGSRRDMVDAFRQFLTEVGRIRTLCIIFDKDSVYYSQKDIPQNLLSQRPLVMEPSNIFSNRLATNKYLNDEYLKNMELKALSTLERMKHSNDIFEIMRPDSTSKYYKDIVTALSFYQSSIPQGVVQQKFFIYNSATKKLQKHLLITLPMPLHAKGSTLRAELAQVLEMPHEAFDLRLRKYKMPGGKLAVRICNKSDYPHLRLFAFTSGEEFSPSQRLGGRRPLKLNDSDTLPLIPGKRIIVVAVKKKKAKAPLPPEIGKKKRKNK